jgi:hypothetical protein
MTAEHPEQERDAGHFDAEVRRALELVDAAAADEPTEKAANMREARLIIEEELLG